MAMTVDEKCVPTAMPSDTTPKTAEWKPIPVTQTPGWIPDPKGPKLNDDGIPMAWIGHYTIRNEDLEIR